MNLFLEDLRVGARQDLIPALPSQTEAESAVRDKPLLIYGLARNRRRSETPVRAAAKRRPPGRGRSGKRWRSLPLEKVQNNLGSMNIRGEGSTTSSVVRPLV